MLVSLLNHRLLASRLDTSIGSRGRELLYLAEEGRVLAMQGFIGGVISFKRDHPQ